MNREAICVGKTVEEALAKAYAELGANSDNSEFEIMQRPARKFFGLKIIPAKVKVSMQVPDEKPVQAPKQPAPKPMQKPAAPAPKPAAPVQRQAAPVPKPAAPAPKPAPKPPVLPRTPFEAKKPVTENRAPAVPVEHSPEATEKVARAVAYLREIFDAMDIASVEIKVNPIQDGAVLTLSGEGLGVLIGRRGETLDALQYLSGLVANRLEGDYFRITIDSGNYREKRERTLEQLAKKLSSQVIKNGRSLTLEPMNPYERRIIHATVQNIDGVTSSSVGEEPNRRVVISATAQRKFPPRDAAKRPPNANRGGNRTQPKPPRDGKPHEFRKNTNTAASVVTRPNAFANAVNNKTQSNAQTPRRIDDSKFEIEPPVRAAVKEAEPKQTAPKKVPLPEVKDKPLYSKIDID